MDNDYRDIDVRDCRFSKHFSFRSFLFQPYSLLKILQQDEPLSGESINDENMWRDPEMPPKLDPYALNNNEPS